ncbi:MAG: hypothetical protein U1F71_15640 [Verrucomicrobiaceae bacterium]
MKTTSSHLIRGVVIAVALLALSQAWRVGQRSEPDPVQDKVIAELKKELVRPEAISKPFVPSENSIEFVHKLRRPHDPWKDSTDPDDVWHQQRQRACELLIRHDLPELDK